jgi:hypothetical protein
MLSYTGDTMFETTIWTNGKPNAHTGSGYGINIPLKIRVFFLTEN